MCGGGGGGVGMRKGPVGMGHIDAGAAGGVGGAPGAGLAVGGEQRQAGRRPRLAGPARAR
mgnify:CR=1 FL=1